MHCYILWSDYISMNVQYLPNTLRLTYEEGIQMLKVSLNIS